MTEDLTPVYDYALETALILRCTVCGGWWSLNGGDPTRVYTCPYCGVRLSPPQYPDDPPKPQPRRAEEVPL